MSRVIVANAIECPVCHKEKFINYHEAKGQTSQRCHNCGRFLILDWDEMKATESKPIKGAYKLVVNS